MTFLQKLMGQLRSGKTGREERCELNARRGGRTRDPLDSASETHRNGRENMPELQAHYDQELADLGYECNCMKAQLATYDSRSKASLESSRIFQDNLEAYGKASLSLRHY